MKKFLLTSTVCIISIIIIKATTIYSRPIFKESYGTEFYGSSTSLNKTFEEVSVINWSAQSYMGGGNIIVSFKLSGAESAVESFSLLNQYSVKSGTIGNYDNISTYNLSGDVTCSNPSYSGASGRISFEAFVAGLN
jgi:hypothetical protein